MSPTKGCPFCALELDVEKHVASNRYVFVVASEDPKAETHLLVIPRRHVESLNDAWTTEVVQLHQKIVQTMKDRGLAEGYRVIVNVGEGGKQKVPHLHYHVLAGPEVLEDGFARGVE